ncbi:carph-isopro domain-containing protein [Hydrogenophaga sp.]|uniref:carph-isopro domain-containing protein n=1 Tax=Hydrogenophaga sp. TaxID=1904254 RepID=UPI002731FD99|nr:YdaS family helix-turn-helix protein [Hydrogenophaga sp.]MDP2074614.1 YdaS family helix-turn-helix protein [Hydrogenophaga sp.]MDP3106417.1 YdaS family helix-turn-helix protein [Hydrogenophaga sp.]
MIDTAPDSPIQLAIRAAGGASALATHFGIARVSVHEWVKNGRVPAEKAPIVAELAAKAGTYFTLEQLCPPVPWGVAASHMAGEKLLSN